MQGAPAPSRQGTGGWSGSAAGPMLAVAFGVETRKVSGAARLRVPPVGSTGSGSVCGPPVGDRRLSCSARPRWIPLGRLTPLPTPPPKALRLASPLRPGWPPPRGRGSHGGGSPFGVRAACCSSFPHPLSLAPRCRRRRGRFPQSLHGIQVNLFGHIAPKGSSLGGFPHEPARCLKTARKPACSKW